MRRSVGRFVTAVGVAALVSTIGVGSVGAAAALTGTTTPATLSSAATNNLNRRDHAFMSFSPRSAGSPSFRPRTAVPYQ